MISIETYALLSTTMAGAFTNRDLQIAICEANGITIEQWDEGSKHYIEMMMNPAESSKIIAAMTANAMSGKRPNDPKPIAQGTPKPQSFSAHQLQAWVNDGVQNVLFKKDDLFVQLQLDLNTEQAKEVYITVNGADYSLYGGVKSVFMDRNALQLLFNDEGINKLGISELKIDFDIHPKKFIHLRYVIAGIYGNTFVRNELIIEDQFSFGNVSYDFSWQSFQTNGMDISIRPNLQYFKDSGEYNLVAMPSYMLGQTGNSEMDLKMFQHALDAWVIYFEMDMTSVVTMVIKTGTYHQVYIYSKLSQDEFMQRMNESSSFTPVIPLEFNGGTDPSWENYSKCLADYYSTKN